MFYIELK